ncbi:unnamed protein product [Adineta ricciae]|uniref:G-protein coupled receptors family 1 profile domain-containing protein n=1 Tax=Adineta ricciae TaxID=249248 RepID=A0A813VD44_ADIRI|nr:unnamed protein product [Adineta ricciae]
MFSQVDVSILFDDISMQINRYFSIILLLFGTIGNVLNCFILSQPPLRSNPCAYLFHMSSIANLVSISIGLSTRILSGWHLDLTSTNSYFCKIRVYIMFVSRTVAFWLIALATIDRWCSSCSQFHRRQLSSLRNARRGVVFIICACCLSYCEVVYCYDANLADAPLQCFGKNVRCRLVSDLIYALVTIFCPILVMLLFGLMTISNVRQTYSTGMIRLRTCRTCRETPRDAPAQHQRRRRLDRYLRHVLFRQVILLILLTFPQIIEKLYTTLTMNRRKTLLQTATDNLLYSFISLLSYSASGMPFYIYTLSGGDIFRRACLIRLQSLYRC